MPTYLLSSGPAELAKFMRRFLTGYPVSYNLRHRRHGHQWPLAPPVEYPTEA